MLVLLLIVNIAGQFFVNVSMNVGVVFGPALAGFALAFGATFRQLFLAAAVGCLAAMVIAAVWFREYDLIPSLLTVLQDVNSPHADMAAETLLGFQLATSLRKNIDGIISDGTLVRLIRETPPPVIPKYEK